MSEDTPQPEPASAGAELQANNELESQVAESATAIGLSPDAEQPETNASSQPDQSQAEAEAEAVAEAEAEADAQVPEAAHEPEAAVEAQGQEQEREQAGASSSSDALEQPGNESGHETEEDEEDEEEDEEDQHPPADGEDPDDNFDLKLEEILDASNFLFELREEKSAIVELLRMPGVLEVLIDFACGYRIAQVKEVFDELEIFQVHQRRSLVALQALETEWLLGIVIHEEDLLDRLFNFLQTKINGQSDHVSSASFARVVNLLFDRYPNELVTYFLSRDWIVEHFVENVTDPNLMDLLYRFVDSRITHQWLYEHHLIHFLVALFLYCRDPLKHEAAAEVLVQLFCLCQRWTNSALVNELFKKEEITDQLLQHASKVGEYQSASIRQGLSVVIAILSLLILTDEEPTFVTVICSRLGHFVNLLRGVVPTARGEASALELPSGASSHTENSPLVLANNETVPIVFGSTRMKILEFITTAMMCGYNEISTQLHIEGFFEITIDLFFVYKWNNFLHNHVDQILITLFSSGDTGMILAVLESSQLPHRIIKQFMEADIGYRGHLVNIVREMIKLSSEYVAIRDYLLSIPGWADFLDETYQAVELKHSTPIAGESLTGDNDLGDNDSLISLLNELGKATSGQYEDYDEGQYQDEIDGYDDGYGDGSSEEEDYDHEGIANEDHGENTGVQEGPDGKWGY